MNLEQKIIKPKLGLLELAKHLGSVSSACKAMGYTNCTNKMNKCAKNFYILETI
jgi:molybdenum-dependent DNA-binding transcriptional regulator ModE